MNLIGLLLVLFGIFAIAFRSVTFFTTDVVAGPAGFFTWDVAQPHTIFFGPVIGIVALLAGVLLLAMDRRTEHA